jgi:hypothetical protein
MSEGTRTSKAIKGTRRSDGAKEAEGVKQGGKISFAAISNRWDCMKVHFNSVDFFSFNSEKSFTLKIGIKIDQDWNWCIPLLLLVYELEDLENFLLNSVLSRMNS